MRRVVCGIVLAATAAQACEPGFHRADDGSCVPAVVGYSPEPEPGPGLAPEPEPGLVPEPEPEPEAMVSTGLAVAMSLISLLAEFFYGLTSFGPAITFNIGWQMCYVMDLSDGGLTNVTKNLMVMELFSASIQLTHLWRFADFRFALANVAPTLLFTAIGTYLLILADSVWLKRTLAVLLIAMALQRVRARCKADAAALIPLHASPDQLVNATLDTSAPLPIEQRDPWAKSGLDLKDRNDLFGVVVCGVGVGLLGGIFGVGGPPGMLFVSYYENRLDLKVWRAVSAFRRVGMNLARLVVFVSKGAMDVEHQWPLYVGMLCGAALGLLVGNILNSRWKVDSKKLHPFIVSLMIYGGVLLMVSGASQLVEEWAMGLIVGAALLSVLVAGCLHCYEARAARDTGQGGMNERLLDKYASVAVTSAPVGYTLPPATKKAARKQAKAKRASAAGVGGGGLRPGME